MPRVRRQPMPELAEKIAHASQLADELRAATEQAEQARARFNEALKEAHAAGASFALLGQVVGLSKQRVARIVRGG